jgi:hypothetical protein
VIAVASFAAPAAAVEIEVGRAPGVPNETLVIDVVLHTGGAAVAGTQNDIAFQPETPIAANADGRPDCWVNPALDKPASAAAFQPRGCVPAITCAGARVIIFAFDNVNPIADGALLYSCRLDVRIHAPAQSYPLPCSNAAASDPRGVALETTCVSGAVLPPVWTPRSTETETPTRTPLPTLDPNEPRGLGTPCDANAQCRSHQCDAGICDLDPGDALPPTRKPTTSPTSTPPAVPPSRSTNTPRPGLTGGGACAITSPDRRDAWWLLIAPTFLAAFLRRPTAFRNH